MASGRVSAANCRGLMVEQTSFLFLLEGFLDVEWCVTKSRLHVCKRDEYHGSQDDHRVFTECLEFSMGLVGF